MSNHSDPQASPPLDADDPRLSEWIDGRLSPAEAVEVERAVRSSPALAQLVDDLRAIKAAARQVPAAAPPAGFAGRVMEAVLSGGDAAADAAADRAVEQEWQSIETERIAEERAEAAADLVPGPAAAASGWSWPRLTIAAALAAGLLATVVLNRPEEGPREIAELAAKPELDRIDATTRRRSAPADEEATRPLAAPAAGAALPPAAAVAARSLEANGRLRESKAKAAADTPAPDLPVVIAVASWTEFDQLLEAHGIEAKPIEAGAGDDRADESGDWTLELSGPSAGLEALLAAAGVDGLGKRQAAAGEELTRQGEAAFAAPAAERTAEKAQLRGRGPGGRLLVRLVIAKPAISQPAKPVTGEGDEVRRE
jgi:hypothetical protein